MNDRITLSHLNSIANRFVDEYRIGKRNGDLTDEDIRKMLEKFIEPYDGSKIMLEVEFVKNDRPIYFSNERGHKLLVYYEVTEAIPSLNGYNVPDINGTLRLFDPDHSTPLLEYQVSQKTEECRCCWDPSLKLWEFLYGDSDTKGRVLKRPAMGYDMFSPI